ncbi:MAG: glycosyltransferase family 2 protein [Uliginosibacterium sp.]|nr:glycosyltransferase family 2 protein [Uliginosibacterium sp.]
MSNSSVQYQQRLVTIVAPFFNESEGVELYFTHILPVVDALSGLSFEFVCVDDGSRDDTLARLQAFAQREPRVRVVELSRNFGKEAALTAGIDHARGAAVIPIDADLQDPPELIPSLIEAWQGGADVVVARRADRRADSWLKRKTAEWFYRLHNALSDVKIPQNVGDFRLMDRRVIEVLKQLPERQRFMKGPFAWVGFRTVEIEYTRKPRAAGESKFSGWKLWNFALEGITSFSIAPLKIWTYVGLAGALLSFMYGSWIVLYTLTQGVAVPGYASMIVTVLFMGSLQLLSVGVLGEYIGRIYLESKQRPRYVVRALHEADRGGKNA